MRKNGIENRTLKYLRPLAICILGILIISVGSVISVTPPVSRKDALISALAKTQLKDGSWNSNSNISSKPESGSIMYTAQAIMIASMLKGLDKINLTAAVDLIAKYMNFTELYDPYTVVSALKEVGSLDQINKTSLIDFVLQRYNETGAFHALRRTEDGVERQVDYFPILYPLSLNADYAYSMDNILSTYLAVSILSTLDALEEINSTKTIEFVHNCQGDNGAFKPFPDARWRYNSEFDADSHETGLAYTYAAVQILKILGHEGDIDTNKVKDYVLACQELNTIFMSNPEDWMNTDGMSYDFMAVSTLRDIGALNKTDEVISNLAELVLRMQHSSGLFEDYGFSLKTIATWFAVKILDTIDLSLLEAPFKPPTLQIHVFVATIGVGLAITLYGLWTWIKKPHSEKPPSLS